VNAPAPAPAGCIACGHGNSRTLRRIRGLCPVCYEKLRAEIRAGQTRWADVEAGGRVLSVNKKGRDRWIRGK
jgi:hypothetical protein